MGADLYVRQGATAPTTGTYTCRSRNTGNPEILLHRQSGGGHLVDPSVRQRLDVLQRRG